MKIVKCDGCLMELRDLDICVTGERVNGLRGGGVPGGSFDLCQPCAGVAFLAARRRSVDSEAARTS